MEKPTAHNNPYMGTTKLPKVSHNLQAAEITSKSVINAQKIMVVKKEMGL